jgi:hypothetical protein
VARRHSDPRTMAPGLKPRTANVARSTPDPGAIAGIVVGSVVAGTLFFIVLGFFYFRLRRRSHHVKDEILADKQPAADRRLSYPGSGFLPGQPQTAQAQRAPSIKDVQVDQGVPTLGEGADLQRSPTTLDGGGFASDSFGQNYTFSSPHQTLSSFPDATISPENIEEASAIPPGAASYYDLNINMDSDPEQPPMAPPTRQATQQLYQEQLRQAREKRKNSKGSFTHLMSRFKRKRSTQSSEVSSQTSPYQTSPSLGLQDVPVASIEGPSNRAADEDQPWQPSPLSAVQAASSQFYEEPQEMAYEVGLDHHVNKRTKQRGPSGDTGSILPHRLDSLRREPTDPRLPSAALRQGPVLPTDKFAARQQTRFQSPSIPDPMEIASSGFIEGDFAPSAIRGSNSPPLQPENFVHPMDIMKPTNETEQAAYTDAELVRIASASASPRNTASPAHTASPSPMPHIKVDPGLEESEEEAEEEGDESDYPESEFEGPSGLEPGQALQFGAPPDGPSDSSTPAAQSFTNTSNGRTPDTIMTPSPTPAPINGYLKAEHSVSPADSATSPRPLLTCEECGRTFDQIHKLNHHKRYHDRKHKCPYDGCDKKFGTKTHLDRHINDKHEKKKGYHCTQMGCPYFMGGKQFPRKDNWRRHMQNKHGIIPQFDPEVMDETMG